VKVPVLNLSGGCCVISRQAVCIWNAPFAHPFGRKDTGSPTYTIGVRCRKIAIALKGLAFLDELPDEIDINLVDVSRMR